jgi:hypothetical protein
MALILVPLVSIALVMCVSSLYGMQRGQQDWLTPLVNSLRNARGSFLKRNALRLVGAALAGASWIVNQVVHALSVAVSFRLETFVHWMDGLTRWVGVQAEGLPQLAEDVYHFGRGLLHHHLPKEIHKAVKPVAHAAKVATAGVRKDVQRVTTTVHVITRVVTTRVVPQVHRLTHAIDITIPREFDRVRAREKAFERSVSRPASRWVKAIWRRGWILVGAGLMVKFLLKKFPHLFCRNSTKGLKALCRMPSSLLDLFLGDALLVFAITDICTTMRAIEAVADQAAPLLALLVRAEDDFFDWCGGDLPSAHDAPGYKGPFRASAT